MGKNGKKAKPNKKPRPRVLARYMLLVSALVAALAVGGGVRVNRALISLISTILVAQFCVSVTRQGRLRAVTLRAWLRLKFN